MLVKNEDTRTIFFRIYKFSIFSTLLLNRGAKVTDVKMSKRAARAHARCLRRHGAVLTDRLERMSKPPRRSIIYLWREYAHTLPAETVSIV